jgi:uncharacterized protein (DUF58 family)
MKISAINPVSKIRPGKNFRGMCILGILLLPTRWLFDDVFFLNTLYVIGIYLLLSFLYTYFALDGISIQRKSRYRRRQVGDLFEENIQIVNNFFLPVFWLQIRDQSEIGRSHAYRVIGFLPGRQTRMIRESSYLIQRGKKQLSPIEVGTSDPLGCFVASHKLETQSSVTIFPYRIDLSSAKITNSINDEGKSSQLSLHQTGSMNSSIRTYQMGDSFNRIHWPTTARRGALFTKIADVSIQTQVWIIMDCSLDVHVKKTTTLENERMGFLDAAKLNWKYSLPDDTFEAAVSITSSLAVTFLKKGYSVGLAFNQYPLEILLPDNGLRQQTKILEALTLIKPNSHKPMHLMLQEIAHRINSGGLVFLVSPDDSMELSTAVSRLVQRGLDIRSIHIDRNSYKTEANSLLSINKSTARKYIDYKFGDSLTKLIELF